MSGWASHRTCSSRTGVVQARVEAARERQRRRFEGTGLLSNADMGPAEVREHCQVDEAGKSLLRAAMQQRPEGTHISARAYLELARSSLHPEAGADDRRPGAGNPFRWNGRDRDCAPGGGHPISSEKAGLT
jgi:hypothetical protein